MGVMKKLSFFAFPLLAFAKSPPIRTVFEPEFKYAFTSSKMVFHHPGSHSLRLHLLFVCRNADSRRQ